MRQPRTKRPGHLMIIHMNVNTMELGQARCEKTLGWGGKALQLVTPKKLKTDT